MNTLPCPDILKIYNKFTRVIDLIDSLIVLYKYPMKSKRWQMYIFYHTNCIAVFNAWLLYQRHCKLLKLKSIILSSFQAKVATDLVTTTHSVRSPRSINTQPSVDNHKRRIPLSDIRLDNMAHLPEWSENRESCKNSTCTLLTFVKCQKCDV